MPQNKKHVPVIGAYPPFRASLIKLVESWPERGLGVHEGYLMELTHWAVDPSFAKRFSNASRWLAMYEMHPDLFLAVVHCVRKRRNRRSKSQRIQNFLMVNSEFKPLDHQKEKSIWDMTDAEIATGYQLANPGESIAPDDVTHARRELAADINRGLRYGKHSLWLEAGKKTKKLPIQ